MWLIDFLKAAFGWIPRILRPSSEIIRELKALAEGYQVQAGISQRQAEEWKAMVELSEKRAQHDKRSWGLRLKRYEQRERELMSRYETREVKLLARISKLEGEVEECESNRMESDQHINRLEMDAEERGRRIEDLEQKNERQRQYILVLDRELTILKNRIIRVEEKAHIPAPGLSDEGRIVPPVTKIGKDTGHMPIAEIEEILTPHPELDDDEEDKK